jgi:hypothetical protein
MHNGCVASSPTDFASVVPRAAGLLVVTVDRLPAWMLSTWGATWVSTPAFDGLAAAGITLDRLIATGVDPRATLADLTHDGRVWEAARARGWPAVIVTDDLRMPERPQGVDVVEVPATPADRPAEDDAATNLGRLFARACEVAAAGRHRLVWCHAGSLGVAWDAPPGHREAYVDPEDPPPPSGAAVPSFAVDAETDPDAVMGCRQAFAGQLTLLDACLGPLFAAVRGLEPAWAIAVVGLRGMPLGLHGHVGLRAAADTGGRPFGEWVHLPAIIAAADGAMAGQRFGGLVTPSDVGATLVDLVASPAAACAAAPRDDGRSLTGLFVDWSHQRRDRVIIAAGDERAIATDEWHVVVGRSPEGERVVRLFAKPDDFFELSDVADRCPAVAENLAAALEVQGPQAG